MQNLKTPHLQQLPFNLLIQEASIVVSTKAKPNQVPVLVDQDTSDQAFNQLIKDL